MNSLHPFLILLILIYAIQNCVNAKMKKLAKDELQIDGEQNWQGINSNAIQNASIPGISLTPPIPALMNVHGNVQEVPIPDSNVQIETKLAKVEILKSKKKQNRQNERRAKREEEEEEKAEMEEEPLNDLGDGLEKIVDEVVETGIGPEEEEKSSKKAKKKFSKQAVKKEANIKEKSGGGTAAATTPPTADKKAATGSAQKGKIEGKADEKDKEKGGQMAGTETGGTKPTSQPATASSTDSKSTAAGGKDKAPPATASQMPQGPPMPPPGSIPAPQIAQVQPPQSGPNSSSASSQSQPPIESARPSGMSKVANYKLIYFDARGICEPIRLLFNYAKVPFDDVRISRKQWLALKDSTVYGKVPILEVDGKPLTYCHTIARYLARQFGLAGKDNWEQAKVDEISDFHADVAMDLQPYMYVVAGFHQGDKNTLRQAIFLPNVEKHFPVYVNLLKLSGSGFFMPSGITWVDFVIAEYMTTVRHFEPQILDKYPAITKFVRKVQTQPQIFEYVTNREHQPVRK